MSHNVKHQSYPSTGYTYLLVTYLFTYLLTPCSIVLIEKRRVFNCQKIPRILRNQNVHYLVCKSPLLIPILSQINSVHAHFLKICFNIILPSTSGFSKWPFSLRFPPQYPCIQSPLSVAATCLFHLIFLDFIARIIFYEVYRSLSSSLRNFLHSPFILSPSRQNILHSTIFSHTFSLRSSLNVSDHDNDRYYSKLP